MSTEAGNRQGCSANSFLIRDGVCDEVTNIAKCLYDGGDCCKVDKNTDICQKCTCIMSVDMAELAQTLASKEARTYVGVSDGDISDQDSKFELVDFVEDVITAEVCSQLCISLRDDVNAIDSWIYRTGSNGSMTCECTKFLSCLVERQFESLIGGDDKVDLDLLEPNSAVAMLVHIPGCGRI